MNRVQSVLGIICAFGMLLSCRVGLAAWPTIDKHFRIGTGTDGGVSEISVQPGNKLLVAGSFDAVAGRSRTNIARLHSSGHVGSLRSDYTAQVPDYLFPTIYAIATQPDKRVLIGGCFGLYRLKPHGEVDPSFSSDVPIVNTIVLQRNGKMLVGLYGMTARFRHRPVVRIDVDGSIDETFYCEMTPNTQVFCIVPRSGNRFLVSGNFQLVNGVSRPRLAILNDDGSLDHSFNAGVGLDGPLTKLVLLDKKRLVIGGSYSSFEGVAQGNISRLLLGP